MKILISITFLAGSALWGQGSGSQTSCSNATLQGSYGFIVTGTRLSHVGGPLEAVVGVAMTNFDGNGGLTQTDNIHGSYSGYTTPDRQGSGTYTVNSDCSGTMTLSNQGSPTLTLRIVVVDGGNEVRTAVVAPPQALVTSIGRSVTTRSAK